MPAPEGRSSSAFDGVVSALGAATGDSDLTVSHRLLAPLPPVDHHPAAGLSLGVAQSVLMLESVEVS